MKEPKEVSPETLAGIAGAGGADPELDEVIYAPVTEIETGDLHTFGEAINLGQSE